MVRVAIVGGTGQVGREIVDALQASGQHEILILSRGKPVQHEHGVDTIACTVDYDNKDSLTQILKGVHTLLCFIPVHTDIDNQTQKNLIDAAIAAGVKRYAPSEWAGANLEGMGLHTNKASIRTYLKQINHPKKVLEYSLFQPGIFLDYLAASHQTAKHVAPLQTPINFETRRTIAVAGHDPLYTWTSVRDLAAVVARAVSWEGVWPEQGGISGNKLRASQVVALGEKVRGAAFAIDEVTVEDLQRGTLNVSGLPTMGHKSFSEAEMAQIIKAAYVGILLNGVHGGWDVGTEWNEIFRDYEFEGIKEFVERVWTAKP